MENVTYQAYLTNLELRRQMERDARRARADAVHGLSASLKRTVKQMFRRPVPAVVRPMHLAA